MFTPVDESDPPVTGVLEVIVQPGRESAFEDQLRVLAEASLQQPGHLGLSALRPKMAGEPYRIIYKYDRRSNFDRWHASDERQVLFAAVQQHVTVAKTQELSGLESWLEFDGAAGPPKWKSTLVSWFGIYPVAVISSYLLELAHFHGPVPLRVLALTLMVLPTTAYLVGPRVAHLMRRWLYPTPFKSPE